MPSFDLRLNIILSWGCHPRSLTFIIPFFLFVFKIYTHYCRKACETYCFLKQPNQITAIFNYAVKYYGLRENPCHKAGGMGKKNAEEMLFWTKDEFLRFIEAVKDRPAAYAIFMALYYSGMREGELLALTPADIDLEKQTIRINKSFQRLQGKEIITTPKTPKSNRVVTIPRSLCDCLRDYMAKCYQLRPEDRLFPYGKTYLYKEMLRGSELAGVKKIRVHDLRHSHAAALIEMNVAPKLLQDRLGHERIQTTLDTYGHRYPNAQAEVARQLEDFMSEADGYKKAENVANL